MNPTIWSPELAAVAVFVAVFAITVGIGVIFWAAETPRNASMLDDWLDKP